MVLAAVEVLAVEALALDLAMEVLGMALALMLATWSAQMRFLRSFLHPGLKLLLPSQPPRQPFSLRWMTSHFQ